MPLFVVECEDVKALSNAQIDLLRCGDYLVKKDASGEHAYKVTYKSATGMCITYMDASVIETQSYDKIDGVWTYNSEDKSPVSPDGILDELEDKDLITKTLQQQQPNWIKNISASSFIVNTGCEVEVEYARLYEINNILYGVFITKTTNNTESSLTPNLRIENVEFPEEIASKIYDYNGDTVHDTVSPQSIIAIFDGYTNVDAIGTSTQAKTGRMVNISGANKVTIFMPISAISAGSSLYSEMRFFITLI